jgi:hypothetical protein
MGGKPGGNITGIWMVLTTLAEKRLQLMHDLLPKDERPVARSRTSCMSCSIQTMVGANSWRKHSG